MKGVKLNKKKLRKRLLDLGEKNPKNKVKKIKKLLQAGDIPIIVLICIQSILDKYSPFQFYYLIFSEFAGNNKKKSLLDPDIILNRLFEDKNGNKYPKRHVGILFEWLYIFYPKSKGEGKGTIRMKSEKIQYVLMGIMKIKPQKLGTRKAVESSINMIHIDSATHAQSEQIMRVFTMLQMSELGIPNSQNYHQHLAYLFVFFVFDFRGNSSSSFQGYKFVDDFLRSGSGPIKLNESLLFEAINFYGGVITIEEFGKKVRSRGIDYYFPEGGAKNRLNVNFLFDQHPIIDVSKIAGKDKTFFVNETNFGNRFSQILAKEMSSHDLSWSDILADYMKMYITKSMSLKSGKLNEQDYHYNSGVGRIETDLFIYNKKTKKLIIFEFKDVSEVEEGFFRKNRGYTDLCTSKEDKVVLGAKGSDRRDGCIYKGLTQLRKRSQSKPIDIRNNLGLPSTPIDTYSFLVFENSAFLFNLICREHINHKYPGLFDFDYCIASLSEIEQFISTCVAEGVDFFDFISGKKQDLVKSDKDWADFYLSRSVIVGGNSMPSPDDFTFPSDVKSNLMDYIFSRRGKTTEFEEVFPEYLDTSFKPVGVADLKIY